MSAASGAAPLREDDAGWYLYGVVARAEAPNGFGSRPGIDPRHEVVVRPEGPLAGVTSRVSLDEFDEAALPERLSDAAWLEQKIRAHEQVLEQVLAQTPVLPCRFCTVFRSEDHLRGFLAERRDLLADALARVAGRVELGVKAYAAATEPSTESREATSGRAYLEARQREQRAREELAAFRSRFADELHARLLAGSADGVALALQRPELSGREEEMLFNGAYLVEDRRRFEQELEALAGDYRESGVELELTGPWPPYNFVPAELGRP